MNQNQMNNNSDNKLNVEKFKPAYKSSKPIMLICGHGRPPGKSFASRLINNKNESGDK